MLGDDDDINSNSEYLNSSSDDSNSESGFDDVENDILIVSKKQTVYIEKELLLSVILKM
jgi:hypothetical protein